MNPNTILQGDCLEQLKTLPDNSVDAIVTDPPYGLEFMGKDWDSPWKGVPSPEFNESMKGKLGGFKKLPNHSRVNNVKCRKCNHWKFSGTPCNCDEPDFPNARLMAMKQLEEFFKSWAIECLRVLKPGGFLLSFGGTRTYHRLVCGIEDAGFEIRDTIMWLYGSGFPKSLNIGKQIDKMADEDLEVIEAKKKLGEWLKEKRGNKPQKEISKHFPSKTGGLTGCVANWELGLNLPTWEIWIKLKELLDLDERFDYLIKGRPKDYIPAEREVIGKDYRNRSPFFSGERDDWKITLPSTQEAKEWEGWGTALKPACEPIVIARKPLSEKNVALNVLKWGTGGINIDATRIGTEIIKSRGGRKESVQGVTKNYDYGFNAPHEPLNTEHQGRFPANIILDEEAGEILGEPSRFFYCAKASKSERNFGCDDLEEKDMRYEDGRAKSMEIFSNQYTESSGNPTGRGITSKRANNHPTVKPIALMEYLIKLVSKEGALVLDPFTGSGTTLIACQKLGRKWIGIEKEEEYIKIANARLKPYLEQRKLK